jgi:hypothetical protein
MTTRKIAIGTQVVVAAQALLCLALRGVFPNGLLLSGIVFLPSLSLCVASIIGLWNNRAYGWTTGLAADLLMGLVLLATLRWLSLIPASGFVCLLAPQVREEFLHGTRQI